MTHQKLFDHMSQEKKEIKRVYAVMDSSSDWYVIPIEMKDEFFRLDELCGDENWATALNADNQFNELFSEYRTGGDLNLIELYAKI